MRVGTPLFQSRTGIPGRFANCLLSGSRRFWCVSIPTGQAVSFRHSALLPLILCLSIVSIPNGHPGPFRPSCQTTCSSRSRLSFNPERASQAILTKPLAQATTELEQFQSRTGIPGHSDGVPSGSGLTNLIEFQSRTGIPGHSDGVPSGSGLTNLIEFQSRTGIPGHSDALQAAAQ